MYKITITKTIYLEPSPLVETLEQAVEMIKSDPLVALTVWDGEYDVNGENDD